MNFKKLLVCGLAVVGFSTISKAQVFEKAYYDANIDHNHYNIERIPGANGEYAVAGTKFKGNNEYIHVMKINSSGNPIWERFIGVNGVARALDVTVSNHGITIAGYITVNGAQEMYAATFDMTGVKTADVTIASNSDNAAGTNIIYNPNKDVFVMGGFRSDNFANPLGTHDYAMVVELDGGSLNYTGNSREFVSVTEDHASINDIVLLTNGEYYVTGSLGIQTTSTPELQGVLLAYLDDNLNLNSNLSFESTNSEHCGVSLVYDDQSDEIYLMSNNSFIHNPQITTVSNATSSPVISNQYYLELDPTYGQHNAAGFQLMLEPQSNELIAMGYHRTGWYGGTSNTNATPWVTVFEKSSGAQIAGYIFTIPSANFHTHGGGLFSTFSGEHPYIFNQEIFDIGLKDGDWVFIAPHDLTGKYGFDIATFNLNLLPKANCVKPISFDNISITETSVSMNAYLPIITDNSPNLNYSAYNTPITDYCLYWPRGYKSSAWTQVAADSDEPVSLEESEGQVRAYPSPFNEELHLVFEGSVDQASIRIFNATGQEVYRNENISADYLDVVINTSEYEGGIYTIQFTQGGQLTTKKLIKL